MAVNLPQDHMPWDGFISQEMNKLLDELIQFLDLVVTKINVMKKYLPFLATTNK